MDMLFILGIFGEEVGYGDNVIPADRQGYEYAKRLYRVVEGLLAEGKLKVHTPKVVGEGRGLDGVFEAMEVAKKGGGSGVKLVVKL